MGEAGTLPAAPDHTLRLTHTHTGGAEPSLHLPLLLPFLSRLLLCSSFRTVSLSCSSFTTQSTGSLRAVLLLREKCGAVSCVLRSPLPLLGFLGATWQPWL